MIYFDYNATAPLHKNVIKKIQSLKFEEFGNPSSVHKIGRNSKKIVEEVRRNILSTLKAKKGSIINTASFVATMGAATSQIAYTASKGGVLAMSRELGVQFAREGIRVNALSPGPVNTPLLQELFAKDKERAARRLVHIPMGRFADASEIAAAVAFLASDDSSFITAANFLVDGGISGAYVTPLDN